MTKTLWFSLIGQVNPNIKTALKIPRKLHKPVQKFQRLKQQTLFGFDPAQLKHSEYLPIAVTELSWYYLKTCKQQKVLIKSNQKLLQNAHENYPIVEGVMKSSKSSLLHQTSFTGYQLLHKNMPKALPTVQQEAAKRFSSLSEGAYNAPRIVSISENATRVLTCIEYDSNSNKLCYL